LINSSLLTCVSGLFVLPEVDDV